MGRFKVEVEVANYDDILAARRGFLEPEKVRRLKIKGVADSGANRLVLPKKVVQQLGLPLSDKVKVRYADNRTAFRQMAESAYVELLGRHGTFTAIVEPRRQDAIIYRDLDLLVDCPNEQVIPRDPSVATYEIE
jgi:predicted aspartyl protease